MATSKTINPTSQTVSIPAFTDQPDIRVITNDIDKTIDGVNTNYTAINNVQDGLAIVANGNTHVAISSGQFVYVKNHSTLNDGLYVASANIAANATLSSSNLTADAKGGLNALNDKMATNLNYNSTITLNNGNNMGEYSDSALYTLLKNDSNIKQSQFCYFSVAASGGKRYGWCYLYDGPKTYGTIFVCRYGENPRYVAVVDGAVSLRQWATT